MFRIIRVVVAVLIIIVVLLGLLAAVFVPRAMRQSFPQTDGDIHLDGLDGEVDIYRDALGVPQIYASTTHDLFFAQGYVHAQDRFWQMDFWRHQGAGRLSELLGENTLDVDRFIRTLGWERVARQELGLLDTDSLAILEAYSQGVNAYLRDHRGTALSMEYFFLPLLNRGYEPEPWQPLHTLTWAKAMAWDLRGNMDSEIDRAMLLKSLPPEQVDQLFPPYPAEHPVIVNHPHLTAQGDLPQQAGLGEISFALQALAETQSIAHRLQALGGGTAGVGSNSWVISGELTDTGMPLLANDPHLSSQMPSIWYQVGLHCAPKGPDCLLEVAGVSFAGAPGVIIGHNDRIAWGFTNVGPDVMDLYIEKINPENQNQYEYQGRWEDMQVLTESIEIAGGETVEMPVRLTRHGPVITEVYDLGEFAEQTGIEMPESYAIALRWTALEPKYVFRSIWNLNRAQNWEDFREAARELAVPAQNLVYADVDGNIGYQMPGDIPIRTPAHSGKLPVPGWTGEYEWQGYIPFEELPFTFNPPENYIVTANNAVVGPQYPYTISTEWDYGYRARRIVEMIEDAPGAIDIAYIQEMQADNQDPSAAFIVPVLEQVSLEDPGLQAARDLLDGWDYQNHMDSAQAALYAAFWKHLLLRTFKDDLPEFYAPWGGDNWAAIMQSLVDSPEDAWWDDRNTPSQENRDDIFRNAFSAALSEMQETQGRDSSSWSWGDLHTLTFSHAVMDNFPLIDRLFNRGPFRTSGGASVVNNTVWDASEDYQVGTVPSMRMIVDLGSLQNSLLIHTTGQSGHAGHPHYIDMADMWRTIQYSPMLWERSQVEGAAQELLQLMP